MLLAPVIPFMTMRILKLIIYGRLLRVHLRLPLWPAIASKKGHSRCLKAVGCFGLLPYATAYTIIPWDILYFFLLVLASHVIAFASKFNNVQTKICRGPEKRKFVKENFYLWSNFRLISYGVCSNQMRKICARMWHTLLPHSIDNNDLHL